jgi:Kef-type K+ transport system membrane component KefB
MSSAPASTFSETRTYLSYLFLLVFSVAGIWGILAKGSHLNSQRTLSEAPAASAHAGVAPKAVRPHQSTGIGSELWTNLRGPLGILFTQIIVILIAARVFNRIFKLIGQPPVMGEMVAGIVLGPSVLGLIYPAAMNFIFPASSMDTLRLLSQLGVVLFMFVVGMELNLTHVREKGSAAIMISHASILVPFLLGTALSLFLFQSLAPIGTSFSAFALFIGVAMSITAFPVLARILEDRGLSKTVLGNIAITCAAVDDVTAWCILALVIAIVQASGITISLGTVLLPSVFVVAMLFIVRPWLSRRVNHETYGQSADRRMIATVMIIVLACSLITEAIGIHALFGAFMAGVVMPESFEFRRFLREKLETFSSSALLPLFFAFTGLRTEIGLLNDWSSWLMTLLIIAVAIAGKLGGSMLMSRWIGMSWSHSYAIGVLMNTRGLIELVVLNIGYDLGILSGRIFAMLVIMALVTTFMTGPLLSLVKKELEQPLTA